jgi:hypothetical protein
MRRKLPSSLERRVLVKNRHCCCICQNDGYGKEIEVHHIDGKNSNNVESNLAVLCLVHASQADAGLKKGKLGSGKKLKPDAVRQYKKTWERRLELELQHRNKPQIRPNMGNRVELKQLKREALAASRREPEDMAMFEQKVIEIDLLNSISSKDKVSTFLELGQEVALNSDRGTVILTGQILWQLVGSYGTSRKLLNQIAEALWDIGLNAVEYGRNKDTIQTVANAILEVGKQARINNAHEAVMACREGLNSMLTCAHSDKREHVVGLLEDAVTSFAKR